MFLHKHPQSHHRRPIKYFVHVHVELLIPMPTFPSLFSDHGYLTGLKPNLEDVPVIPASITGCCVYGHIITDEHRDHFRRLHPNIEEWQSCNPKGLVSIASVVNFQRGSDLPSTAKVYDQGKWHTCVVYLDYRGPGRLYDLRWATKFTHDLEKSLGITGKPKWYPRYVVTNDSEGLSAEAMGRERNEQS